MNLEISPKAICNNCELIDLNEFIEKGLVSLHF